MKTLHPSSLESLARRNAPEGSWILSVYLNVDPQVRANRRGAHKLVLDQLLKDLESHLADEDQRDHFQEDADWIRRQVEVHIPKGRSMVFFCDLSEGYTYQEDLPVRLPNGAWYEKRPHIRPLLDAWKEHERTGIVVVDRERARLLVASMGEVEEMEEAFQTPAVHHRSTAGSDHMRSQMVFQRRAATWSHWFLKEVADALHDMMDAYQIDRVVLAGPEEVTAELKRLLPKGVLSRVAARIRASVAAKAQDLLDQAAPVLRQLDAARERELVDECITTARKAQSESPKAVLGLEAVLDAVNQGRVYQILVPEGFSAPGWHCPSCRVLLDHGPAQQTCPYCSGALKEEDDAVWAACDRVLLLGGRVEEIRDPEAVQALQSAGPVGAFLR
ncbi:Protein required for attachment to host cells [Desulfacinum hydrothermale DSM 13146]|uniref:Protein required for attachment to host cells n=1 Tax=Desulfacinum hydrothermale DSM 13146 TaxID=1121390 RepID=A0A1W1X0B6_9BACT|nr:VLRF1 family aeRF1-type release factor [Desulfacinum hydrothermale]SMC17230.1 Protein required for attachment to host cells [Desulfacinum hydrothermale DSM 13146]